jgi:hypothetical protein
VSAGGPWPAIEEIYQDANYNFQIHNAAAIKASKAQKRLGVWVVIVSAIVSTSVFGALPQKNPIMFVQIGTGLLSVLATVLAAVQTFYGFSKAANDHNKAANIFLSVCRQTSLFLQRHDDIAASDKTRLEEARSREAEIIAAFNAAKKLPPSLLTAESV